MSCEYLREFSKKFETALLVYSGASGKLIHEKKQKSKISWHCPFKILRLLMPTLVFLGDTIYVWLDALANYLTVAGYGTPHFQWPPSVHVIGMQGNAEDSDPDPDLLAT